MTRRTLTNQDWRRFHDPHAVIACPDTDVTLVGGAADIIAEISERPGESLHAAGSHWALSTTTVPDGRSVELNWPAHQVPAPTPPPSPAATGEERDFEALMSDAMWSHLLSNPFASPSMLQDDPCLDESESIFFVHLQGGTRIYDAYATLDDPARATTVAGALVGKLPGDPYSIEWGFPTLGGAGGQTVFGALTTGTHGGDFRQSPIADGVLAVHLITEGGRHRWIEPSVGPFGVPLTDDDKLHARYDAIGAGGAGVDFEVVRDDGLFRAVLVGAGRFGVVASFVLRVVPQYCLVEHRRLGTWREVKQALGSAGHHAFDRAWFASGTDPDDIARFVHDYGEETRSRFLQIAVELSPDGRGGRRCGVTQRWFTPMAAPNAIGTDGIVNGRVERAGQNAGSAGSYDPDGDVDELGGNSTFLSRACSSGNFIAGLLDGIADELEKAVAEGAVPAGGIIIGALAIGAGSAVLATAATLCAAIAAIIVLLRALADAIEAAGDTSLASVVDDVVSAVLDNPLIPEVLGLELLRVVFDQVFRSQQSDRDYAAISYAVMDTHDYRDRSCFGNAESLEVFFDASRPDLYCAYVDAILDFEAWQEEQRHAFAVGYVSLRYVRGSTALIAPAHFPDTVAIEIAALRDAAGSVDFVMNAAKLAQNPTFGAAFHWGQYNPIDAAQLAAHFAALGSDRLDRWRDALRATSGGGTTFSNAFTRHVGLEP